LAVADVDVAELQDRVEVAEAAAEKEAKARQEAEVAHQEAEVARRDSVKARDKSEQQVDELQADLVEEREARRKAETAAEEELTAHEETRTAAEENEQTLMNCKNSLEQSKARLRALRQYALPLAPWNPLDHMRLLWWVLVNPWRLSNYRDVFDGPEWRYYSKRSERRIGTWLSSTLAWLPILVVTLGYGLNNSGTTSFLEVMAWRAISLGLAAAWLLTGLLGRDRLGTDDLISVVSFLLATIATGGFMGFVAGSITYGPIIAAVISITAVGALIVRTHVADVVEYFEVGARAIIAASLLSGAFAGALVSGGVGTIAIGAAVAVAVAVAIAACLADHAVLEWFSNSRDAIAGAAVGSTVGGIAGGASGMTMRIIGSSAWGLVATVVAGAIIGLAASTVFVTVLKASSDRITDGLRGQKRSWLARIIFAMLVLSYAFLIWFSFLGGYQILR
jgi:hypothetical protein